MIVRRPAHSRNLVTALAGLCGGGVMLALSASSCSGADRAQGVQDATVDAATLPTLEAGALPPDGAFCALPGSIVSTADGPMAVPGPATPDLAWLKVPTGFCVHYFATVPKVRQLKFAPDGDLFAASPTTSTTGGAAFGQGAIFALPDDDHDGVADSNLVFVNNLPSVQGLMFGGGYFYYQDTTVIRRVAFRTGDRAPSAAIEQVTEMNTWPQDSLHWPKVFDTAQDGTMYISNGSTQSETCKSTRPVFGAIFQLNGDGTTSEVAKGFRNPIAMRCEANHDVCLVIELALDYSAEQGGREKLLPIHPGDDWGYPCCATKGVPYTGVVYTDAPNAGQTPDCSGVAAETGAFIIGHTPFGLDFETGRWPAPWQGRVFLTLHGAYGSWEGARVTAIPLDPTTGLPSPASELTDADPSGNLLDFATGWDDGLQDHGRPAAIAFSSDGRLFLGDDQLGIVVWIAPTDLMRP